MLTFSELFIESVKVHGGIVMGIYRLLNILVKNDPEYKDNRSIDDSKRIVIYNPPYNYKIDSSDMVCYQQINLTLTFFKKYSL